jgi:hypothetical protein
MTTINFRSKFIVRGEGARCSNIVVAADCASIAGRSGSDGTIDR